VAELTDLVTTPSGEVESYDTVIQIILKAVEPDGWDSVGGPGSIQEFPPSKSLVINQTGENHDRIQALLAELRQNKKPSTAK
jgi:ABC-type transport system substrate-binding protein